MDLFLSAIINLRIQASDFIEVFKFRFPWSFFRIRFRLWIFVWNATWNLLNLWRRIGSVLGKFCASWEDGLFCSGWVECLINVNEIKLVGCVVEVYYILVDCVPICINCGGEGTEISCCNCGSISLCNFTTFCFMCYIRYINVQGCYILLINKPLCKMAFLIPANIPGCELYFVIYVAFFLVIHAWYILFHPFTFNVFASLYIKYYFL